MMKAVEREFLHSRRKQRVERDLWAPGRLKPRESGVSAEV